MHPTKKKNGNAHTLSMYSIVYVAIVYVATFLVTEEQDVILEGC